MDSQLPMIRQSIPANFRWSLDHTVPYGTPHSRMTVDTFQEFSEQLKHVKKSELTCGIDLSKELVVNMDSNRFLDKAEQTIEELFPLYRLSF